MSGRFSFRSLSTHPSTSNPAAAAAAAAAANAGQDPREPAENEVNHDAAVAESAFPASSSPSSALRPLAPRSTTLALPLSSSFTQKAPARSFVHHSAAQNASTADPTHYSTASVREQTASLAQDHLSYHRRRGSSTVLFDDSRPRFRKDSSTSNHAVDDPINVTHSGTLDSSNSHASALTDLFNHRDSQDTRNRLPSFGRVHNPRGSIHSAAPAAHTQQQHHTKQSASNSSHPATTCGQGDMPTEQTPLLARIDSIDTVVTPSATLKQRYISDGHDDDDDVETQIFGRPRPPNKLRQLLGYAKRRSTHYVHLLVTPKKWSAKAVWDKAVVQPLWLLPCVFLGLLLNVLDALSYGMILFPLGEPIFADTGPDGISMFYVSCIVSQLVYSCGGSIFRGAVGSEMIEVVPFFHKMTYSIMAKTGTSDPKVVLATVITSYAMSSMVTGLVFFALGAFRLGSLVSFFPRHILIGCIGGVGFFLFVTGIEVSARLEGNLEYNMATLQALFKKDTVALWTIPFALSLVLMIMKKRITSPVVLPYIVPVFFIAVAGIFYIVVTAVPWLNIQQMRDDGWIFAKVQAGVPFYHFYSYYDFKAVDWNALTSTIPAMFALTFFGVLHVPINVPALAVAAKEDDLNLNRELVAHGFSNALSGMCGSIQNYLVYVNSELFMSNGGDNRLAGIMLAFATFGVLIAGPDMIGFVPIMVVGALIFYLGIDLLDEALVDTWARMGTLEYLTVLAIVLVMGVYDFVGGILVGIVLACLNFVVQTSRKSATRATYSGEDVQSTVRRHFVQRCFLRKVGYQIYVTKLAGYLFFGSIVQVEKNSRALIEEEAFRKQPIRYLIFDLSHVSGIDYSAAEAFVRMQRVIQRRGVRMIVSGVVAGTEVGIGLTNVGLWTDHAQQTRDEKVDFFDNLNSALEYCENELLKPLYQEESFRASTANTPPSLDIPGATSTGRPAGETLTPGFGQESMLAASPRRNFLAQAATTTLDNLLPPTKWANFAQPLPLLLQTFQDLSSKNEDFWSKAMPYFKRCTYSTGELLFHRDDVPDAFYLLESGILRANYMIHGGGFQETIVAGTTCGELPFFSNTRRTATVVAERDCVCWTLNAERWGNMQKEWPEGSRELLKCALILTKERVDAITGYQIAAAA